MEIEEIESIMLTVCVTGIVIFMGFIMVDLARKSNAGKLGTFVILGGLGLGVLGFVMKGVIVELILGVKL
ncbi:MAG: DUF2788 domain-containing protein [Marinomonas sp.]|jgi:hypothetical protein|uniref:DUF2788 domain-containing protein n=1 Tax=unclassified Marinomonas TaxID=196814 RepID=UPI0005F9AD0C|nr:MULTISPECIES: DUF2788 domain-containing protein [unclassified Marinomonas]KJZ10644.1 hypothetical protein TW85_19250 [Marinomonas sp. S3726]KZM39000.1 hypothetical protein OA92_21840 [Marinomonas sp. SBI22]KZM39687.1 hypothetical protein OA91_21690 [Marinomonas sp. SBI8L]